MRVLPGVDDRVDFVDNRYSIALSLYCCTARYCTWYAVGLLSLPIDPLSGLHGFRHGRVGRSRGVYVLLLLRTTTYSSNELHEVLRIDSGVPDTNSSSILYLER